MSLCSAARLADRIDRLMPSVRFRKAVGPTEKAEIHFLRYPACLHDGARPADPSLQMSDCFDASPNGHTIAMYLHDQLCGSVRVHVASCRGHGQSPARQVFPEILSKCLNRGDTIVDTDRFVIAPAASRACPELAHILLRVPFIAAFHFDADLMTAAVCAEHQAAFRRILRFKVAASARACPSLLSPVSLMTARFRLEANDILRNCPFFMPRHGEGEALFGVSWATTPESPNSLLPQYDLSFWEATQ